ncbi:MlaA family lipoprotein [Acidithiobacillus acidisediminis]|uniref:MlaA family lipoprotein n=1 Tax=Acidithiobacillus acidisediminis TaxID=2937799 RepID=UPI0031FE8105
MKFARWSMLLGLVGLLSLGGCATMQGPATKSSGDNDPFEPVNKPIFHANLWLFRNVLSPVNQGYEAVTPKFFRSSVSNVFANADMPYIFVNDFLQGRVQPGMEGLSRFLVNTIFGLGGIFDVANKLDLPKQDNSFGVTLGVWGVPQGPYLVLPFYGPSSLRNLPGMALAIFVSPPYYFPTSNAQWAWSGMSVINTGHVDAPQVKMVEDAVNPYIFARNAWEQHEQFLIDGGKVSKEQLLQGLDLPPTAATASGAAVP